jgi:capsid protein
LNQLVNQFATCAGYEPIDCSPDATTSLGYAAAEPGRRRMVTPTTRSEDQILDVSKRRIVIEDARDLRRNYSIAAWAIRRHLDYVASFHFQCKTKDKGLNTAVERFMRSAGTARRWDVTRRHSFRSMTRLAESHAVVDGDVGWHLLKTGRVQAIEGERIRTPVSVPDGTNVDVQSLVHGVKLDKAGGAVDYAVNRRSRHGGWEFERLVPARHLLLHGVFERYDKVRGISPLTSALNSFRDTYEAFDYALAKSKVSQLFGLAFKRDGGEPLGELNQGGYVEEEEEGAEDSDEPRYNVDISQGSPVLDLDPGDDVDILESRTPSTEFQSFMTAVIMAALKSLDIPYCFYDEDHTTYSGSRQAWLQYDHAATEKRERLREFLDTVVRWRLAVAVLAGELILPRRTTVADLPLRFIPLGVPWIDPLKEVVADNRAVEGKLTSRQRICFRRGGDWFEIADELEEEEQYMRGKRIQQATSA